MHKDQVTSSAFRLTQFKAVKIKTPVSNGNNNTCNLKTHHLFIGVCEHRSLHQTACLSVLTLRSITENKVEQQMAIGHGHLWRYKPSVRGNERRRGRNGEN